MSEHAHKVVIIGGVAGGASAAARARRLSEHSPIVLFERGPYVSFANCGLPYYVGGEIVDRKKLLIETPGSLARKLALDVRVNTEVTAIDREQKRVAYRRIADGVTGFESYDKLILATGAAPVRPPIPGIERPGLFTLRDVPDADGIAAWVAGHPTGRAVVIGAGFIGVEMAEQLRRRGMSVALIEALPQILPPLDPELATLVERELQANGVTVHRNDAVAAFVAPASGESCGASVVVTKTGARFPADIVVLGIGVRPETALARAAGLALGTTGGVLVNEQLETSDPDIYAVGDAIEVRGFGLELPSLVPLAGPANRQGRLAADNVFGLKRKYTGSLGTAVVRVFGLVAAVTGASAKLLGHTKHRYSAVAIHPGSHAGYYPGAQPIALKLTFDPESRQVLGAQAVGREGVDKRIDVIATALRFGATVDDLGDLELCYAPPVGSAKDPVNIAGMAAQNVVDGLVTPLAVEDLPSRLQAGAFLLDVREARELDQGIITGAHHIPLGEIRDRMEEIPRERTVIAYCASGQRSYLACRLLTQHGYRCMNLNGAFRTWGARADR